ncbi:MAG: hypothetical protein EOS07_22740 [Mesorhizobium sp.]|uniref:hypothetical protein n=1 Tax=Mesorhizobium sp. TaxID=1871066 RepID=UPI000FE40963|nr:hypothetical protein [Mesorhizobium sp.]RWB00304.1 MAG: hypothetical protein EOQ33_21230 [Mesorhizobium sp.]RWC02161.1 MAG: hypothetical protein EOQ56_09770 [Mesorhizobium sp.]RWO06157.1 MAG: hypothetical protein EOS07_22740 [Mesorhizobium sp.]RWP61570.1 MAG: hypothetical protein EOR07_22500 [Mesorhizobium sp.]RWQ17925.1 MAG: hypothetical protein EOR92_17975 [Mesorhizobium sp.]
MKIVWDEPKRLADIEKHGWILPRWMRNFSLADRLMAIGRMAIGRMIDGIVAVIFARLGSEGITIISMRPANPNERRLFNDKT